MRRCRLDNSTVDVNVENITSPRRIVSASNAHIWILNCGALSCLQFSILYSELQYRKFNLFSLPSWHYSIGQTNLVLDPKSISGQGSRPSISDKTNPKIVDSFLFCTILQLRKPIVAMTWRNFSLSLNPFRFDGVNWTLLLSKYLLPKTLYIRDCNKLIKVVVLEMRDSL